MTTIDTASSLLSEADHRAQLHRAVIASTVGTTIEWYDFFLYGQVTGLVFGKLLFPQSDPLVGVLQAFAIYAVGFVARPVGAAIFGHYGDRIGCKAALAKMGEMAPAYVYSVFVLTYGTTVLGSAKSAAQAILIAQLTASDTDALLPEDPLTCLLVVEILKAERDDFLLSATKEQMDQMERTCKKYGMEWETYIAILHKLALDPSLRRPKSRHAANLAWPLP
jgi:hypothetical protein